MNKLFIPIALLILMQWMACDHRETALLWNKTFFMIGSQSSPRCVDLNEDGVLDIIMGAGKGEIDEVEQGVLAINGIDGSVLWQVKAPASVVGSASFQDVNGDGTEDVFIGGRNQFLVGIDGKSGEVFWSYDYQFESDSILQYAKYNFYNASWVPDQTGDGLEDMIVINGGNWDAAANDDSDRHPGVLLILDPINGEILAADTMPDGQESYMSPVTYQQDGNQFILVGTGGETAGGAFYRSTVSDLIDGRLGSAEILAEDKAHGFISPPAVVDLSGDGILDIAIASHSGKISAINGRDKTVLWSQHFMGKEISNSFAVGHFTRDEVPDLAITMSHGTWPFYTYAHHMAFDGETGKILFSDSTTCFSLSSPIAVDLTKDGQDEVLLSLNRYDCNISFNPDTLAPPQMANEIVIIDYSTGRMQVLDHTDRFMNLFSTPWVGDLDNDRYLDIVYAQFYNPKDIRKFLGMQIKRVSTSVRSSKDIPWGGYQGTDGTSIYSEP